ncbi:MAG: hypothetical protein AAF220_02395 [Pseudomonadota bacterium]
MSPGARDGEYVGMSVQQIGAVKRLRCATVLRWGFLSPARILLVLTTIALGVGLARDGVASDILRGDGYDLVVVLSQGSAIKRGTVLRGDSALNLGASSGLVLLDRAGNSIDLNGPFSGPPLSEPAPTGIVDAVTLMARLIVEQEAAATAGVGRNGKSAVGLPDDPWEVSVHQTGAACALPDRLVLWRTSDQTDGKLQIEMNKAGKKARVTWVQGRKTLPMPAKIFRDGSTYRVWLDDVEEPVEITLYIAPSNNANPVEHALWMAKVGCKSQAMIMLDRIQ